MKYEWKRNLDKGFNGKLCHLSFLHYSNEWTTSWQKPYDDKVQVRKDFIDFW